MGKNNTDLLKLAKKYLGKGGATFRNYCGVGGAWCCSFVTYIFHKGGDTALFYGGKKVSYCPSAITWCKANLAEIPPYLAMASDIIFFDWQPNNVPDHIGFVDYPESCDKIHTVEGNTSGGIVAKRTRSTKYVLGIYRPHFPATFTIGTLEIDGIMGYSTIANLQKALKKKGTYTGEIDGILGKGTVKGIQKLACVTQDGAWGVNTSKGLQKYLGVTADGLFGEKSVKALQKWVNTQNAKTKSQKIADKATSLAYDGFPSKAKYPKGEPKASYKKALEKAYPNRSSWGKASRLGASCDVFVGTVVRASGVDPDFPRGLAEQIPYLKNSDKWVEVSHKKASLKAGYIIVYKRKNAGSHILIVKNSSKHLCEANHASSYGITRKTTKGINYRLKTSNKEWIRAYKAK